MEELFGIDEYLYAVSEDGTTWRYDGETWEEVRDESSEK